MTLRNQLDISSLSQLIEFAQNRNVGIISAFLSSCSNQENLNRSAKLEDEIRGAGYGFYRLEGQYVEDNAYASEQDVHERAVFVIGKEGEDSGNLKGMLAKMGTQYEQNYILLKPHNENKAYLVSTGKNSEGMETNQTTNFCRFECLGQLEPMKLSEYYSQMKGRKFLFESYEQADNWMSAYAKYLETKQSKKSQGE